MAIERSKINQETNDAPIIDITPQGISASIRDVQATGLDIYDQEASARKRTRCIGARRPFIAKLDATLQTLKGLYPPETRTKNGRRQPNPEYQRASTRLREYRKQVSMVQRADRLTLAGKL